jgi:hypothetical protein
MLQHVTKEDEGREEIYAEEEEGIDFTSTRISL